MAFSKLYHTLLSKKFFVDLRQVDSLSMLLTKYLEHDVTDFTANIYSEEHPLGVYHPHAELHHIKKENIGLIEVMGMAILPARLLTEMDALAKAILRGDDLREDPALEKHADWAEEFIGRYSDINSDNVDDILKLEIGKVFARVLEDAGVYKRNAEGQAAFDRFIEAL